MVSSTKMKPILLPLLLLWLGSSLAAAATNLPLPKVTGIINLPGCKQALLESPNPGSPSHRTETAMLQEGQEQDGLQVVQIDAEAGAVTVKRKGIDSAVTIQMMGVTNFSGPGSKTTHPTIQLQEAPLNEVLGLYGYCANRTVLHPTLAATTFTLNAAATNLAEAVVVFSKALEEHGFATVLDGEKFIMVVPADKMSMALPHSAEIKSEPGTKPPVMNPGEISAGELNFPAIDIRQAATIYAELLGRRRLDWTEPFPSTGLISVHTQTPLSKAEAIYLLETLFRWEGVKLVPVGKDLVKGVRISGK